MTVPRGLRSGERAALVVSECQRGMTDPALANRAPLAQQVVGRGILPNIATLAAAARRAGLPVVFSNIVPRADFAGTAVSSPLVAGIRHSQLREGHPSVDLDEQLQPEPSDLVLARRHGVTGFHDTGLDSLLRSYRVETVVLTGVSTNVALPGTTLEATNRGYNVVLVEDATAGGSAETHDFMIREFFPLMAAVSTTEDVLAVWSGPT